MNLIPGDQSTKLKSFWNRPGGKFGVIAGLGLLGIIGYYVLPILTSIVWNTLNFGVALACLGVFLYCITHRKLRMSFFYLYEILMKKLVGVLDCLAIQQNQLCAMYFCLHTHSQPRKGKCHEFYHTCVWHLGLFHWSRSLVFL